MKEVGKIVDNLNIPKQVLDKSESLLKALFGQSVDEIGGMISDNVRLRRFKNQIKIFTKAQKILAEKNIDPSRVSLKVLAPLIEYSSYEEDLSLQKKWANLISFVLSGNDEEFLQGNFVKTLNLLHPTEAKILDSLYREYISRSEKMLALKIETKKNRKSPGNQYFFKLRDSALKKQSYYPDNKIFTITYQAEKQKVEKEKFRHHISNLVSLGLLKWKINFESPEPDGTIIAYEYSDFIFTALGIRFIEVCNAK